MLDPGLVYDANDEDYLKSSRAPASTSACRTWAAPAPDMNVPSFALGNLTGKIEVTRTLTALTPGTYRVKTDLPGSRSR